MLSLIGTIVIGFIAGLIARALKPGDDSARNADDRGEDEAGGVVATVIGIAGALIASYLGRALGWYGPGEAAGFIMSVVGAIVLLFVWGMIKKRNA